MKGVKRMKELWVRHQNLDSHEVHDSICQKLIRLTPNSICGDEFR